MQSNKLPKCPIETTMKLLNTKWKILIIRDLLNGTKRFTELKKALGTITQKVLTKNLREMETDGLIIREIYNEYPPKVNYTLSDIGYSLATVLDGMATWGSAYKEYLKLIKN